MRPALAKVLLAFAVLAPLGLFAFVPSAGRYLDDHLCYQPALKLRLALDLQPVLDERLAVLVFDDASLVKHGREPTFADLTKVADALYDRGLTRVVIAGFHGLDAEIGALDPAWRPRGTLVAGVVVHRPDARGRTMAAKDLAPALLMPPGTGLPAEEAVKVLAPGEKALGALTALGSLNMISDAVAPVAHVTTEGRVLPHLGLLAADGLAVEGERLVTAQGPLNMSPDGRIHVNFVDIVEVLKRSVPLSALLPVDGVYPPVSEKTAARLHGAKVALVVPDGMTGSRFINAPSGPAPSYLALASIANSALNDLFIRRPATPAWMLLPWAIAVLAALLFLPARAALISVAVATLVVGVVGNVLLIGQRLYLPCAQAGAIALCAWSVRAGQHFLRTLVDRLKLSHELATGSTVQRLFLPEALERTFGPWEVRVVYRPHGAMSGDWVQIFDPGPDAPFAVVAIGDVVGKGTSAALLTAAIAAVWEDFKPQWQAGRFDLPELVEKLDRIVLNTFRGEQNTTLSIAVLHANSVVLACFGAPAWLHVKPDGVAETVRIKRQDPIGLKAKTRAMTVTPLTPGAGDVYFAYSDGVMDGTMPRAAFVRALPTRVEALTTDPFATIAATALEFGDDSVHPDDVTMLMVRFRGPDRGTRDNPEAEPLAPAAGYT